MAKRANKAGKPALAKPEKPPATPPPSRGGRPKKEGRSILALTIKAREVGGVCPWKRWLEAYADHLGTERTRAVDRALVIAAALDRYPPPPDRET